MRKRIAVMLRRAADRLDPQWRIGTFHDPPEYRVDPSFFTRARAIRFGNVELRVRD